MSSRQLSRGFGPIAQADARTLILGSLPSRLSLETGEYFANPRNVFWRIMGDLVGAGPELTYSRRKERMTAEGFAVWDVLESAFRPGSLDASIESDTAKPNDFVQFLREHPGIWRVCFNGQKAAELFDRRVIAGIEEQASSMVFVTLPSTSPAHAAMTFEEKSKKWSIIVTGPEVIQENF